MNVAANDPNITIIENKDNYTDDNNSIGSLIQQQQQRLLQQRSFYEPQSPSINNSKSILLLSSSCPNTPLLHSRQHVRKNSWWQQSIVRRTVSFIENELEKVIETSPFLTEHYPKCVPKVGVDYDSYEHDDEYEYDDNDHYDHDDLEDLDDHYTAQEQYLDQQQQEHKQEHKQQQTKIGLFRRSEIITGMCLGHGGFSSVFEILGFQLDEDVTDRCTVLQQQTREHYKETCYNQRTGTYQYAIKFLKERLLAGNDTMLLSASPSQSPYSVGHHMASNHNHKKKKKDYQNAAVDLVIEAAYMSCLHHPNIMSVRGLPVDGLSSLGYGQHDGYFIVMDRLTNTLDHRIYKEWKVQHNQQQQQQQVANVVVKQNTEDDHATTTSSSPTASKDDPFFHQKISYSYQLSLAIQYLHSKNIIFRDIKPHNIGFVTTTTTNHNHNHSNILDNSIDSNDIDDTIANVADIFQQNDDNNNGQHQYDRLVLFDFGLCRELPSIQKPPETYNEETLDTSIDSSVDNDDVVFNEEVETELKQKVNEYEEGSDNEIVFVMSGVGTRRYMAPEIINEYKYNHKCDIYSYAMVLWEMLSLSKPYPEYSATEHKIHVCHNGERPPLVHGIQQESNNNCDMNTQELSSSSILPFTINPIIQNLLQQTWEHQISKRYNMNQVCQVLQSFLLDEHDTNNIVPTSTTIKSSMNQISYYRSISHCSTGGESQQQTMKNMMISVDNKSLEPPSPTTVLDMLHPSCSGGITCTTRNNNKSNNTNNNNNIIMLPHVPMENKRNSNHDVESKTTTMMTTSLLKYNNQDNGGRYFSNFFSSFSLASYLNNNNDESPITTKSFDMIANDDDDQVIIASSLTEPNT